MTKDEALDLALNVMQINLTLLKKINPYKGQEDLLSDSLDLTHKAITAIKQARSAQPAPVQPVWIQPDHLQKAQKAPFLCRVEPHKREDFIPLYTTPPAQPAPVQDQKSCKLCTHEQRHYMEMTGPCRACRFYSNFASATPPAQPAPSLLAFAQNFLNDYQTEDGMQSMKHYAREAQAAIDNAPPAAQRQWVGLTDDAKLDLISDAKGIGGRVRSDAQLLVLLDMQEAKLKEKNNG